MSEAKHTPGPWIARTYPDSKGQIVSIKVWAHDEFHGNLVCAMSPETPAAIQGIEGFANARLIAAAPKMADFIIAKAKLGDSEAKSIMEDVYGNR